MPAPVMRWENLAELCQHALHLQKNARADVDFVLRLPEGALLMPCDQRQVGQALTNLLQNALDAIDGRERGEGGAPPRGRVELAVERAGKSLVVRVIDNGKGLPVDGRERLTEPYVTTRAKGTGLGLAIVKKIMEDHGGELKLADNPGGGSVVSLEFPLPADQEAKSEHEPAGDAGSPLTMKSQAVAHGA